MLCISDVSDMGLHVGDMSLLAYSPHLGDSEYNFCCIPLVIMSPYTYLITSIISNTCNLRIYMCFNVCTGMSINCCWKGGVFRYNDYRVSIGILCDKGPRYGSICREYLIDYYPIYSIWSSGALDVRYVALLSLA